MTTGFLATTPKSAEAGLALQISPNPESKREFITIMVIGSPQGVTNTIYTLYHLGFAEIWEWSKPQPTATPGEVMRFLKRHIFIS